uniref:Soluble scavenger receptor cysteine-rich domain-containing protein SSC5D n=1 Tax=Anolis carolinensis TaxID=28377 RepID=H9GVD8_ANOCA
MWLSLSITFLVMGSSVAESDHMEIRLEGGPNLCSGRVEVFISGEWTSVCDDSWGIEEAMVVCRQLGCGSAVSATHEAQFGNGNVSIGLDDVRCGGTESTLSECPASPWGEHDCSREETAGVVCSGQPWGSDPTHQTEIRLAGGLNNCYGRVELLHHGEWGTICGDGWGTEEATVVCQEMGCGTVSMDQSRTWNESGASPIWLDDVHCRGTESSLHQCSASPLGRHDCDSGETASVVCSEVRLVDGLTPCTGRVEVFHNKGWGTVCDNGWDLEDARVVCQEVGCGKALVAATGARFGQGSGPIWMNQINCTGKENVLKKCPQEKSFNLTCDHRKDAGVECAELRLVNGSSNCSGRVEVFHNETWGTICDAGWDLQDAQVVCRELGCGEALSASGGAQFGRGAGPIWLEGMSCIGKEESLRQCPKGQWGEHSCDHSRDASVECTDPRKIRLVNGFSRCSGRIEVFQNQEWGTLCDFEWDLNDARVLCKELGCGDVISVPWGAHFERTRSPVLPLIFYCNGTEDALNDCENYPMLGGPYCHQGEGAGVVCSELRLVNGPNRCSGYLEVLYNQQWGTVCDIGWDTHDAQVVCRELNCGDNAKAFGGVCYGQGSGPIWLENVNCTGEEIALAECPKSPWGKHSCNHSQDVNVECSGQVRLANGSSLCSGRLEVFLEQQWKSICDDDWDLEGSEIVCRTLNCGHALSAPRGSHFGRKYNTIKIRLDFCNMTTDSLTNCDLRDWGPCDSGGSAGVICSEAHLVNGTNRCSGRVELFHNKQWGTVCDAGWDTYDAQVVCRELGCGNALKAFRGAHHGQGFGPIWLEGVNCTGKETSLRECPQNPWGEHHCNHSQDASVECTGWIRLINGSSHCSGTVEVLHNQHWKAICDKNWGLYEEHVVCREMGCKQIPWNPRSARLLSKYRVNRLSIPFCKWTANDLAECNLTDFKEESCSHGRTVAVTCSGTRLVNGSNRCSGRVETFLHREWRSWCLDEWDLRDAQVVCRELDCGEAESVPGRSFFGRGEGSITFDEPKCLGTEDAFHKYLRLMNGTSPCSGRVEVFHNDTWGTICDAGWDLQDAQVVCSQLGCGKASKALGGAHYGQGSGPIWLENINCTGEEASLKECQKGIWGEHSCSHSQDASVECSGTCLPQVLFPGT